MFGLVLLGSEEVLAVLEDQALSASRCQAKQLTEEAADEEWIFPRSCPAREVALAIGHDEEQSAHRLYGVRAVPSALLIDRGVVRHAATGSRSVTEVLAAWKDSKGGGG